jgi:hypothetical protein
MHIKEAGEKGNNDNHIAILEIEVLDLFSTGRSQRSLQDTYKKELVLEYLIRRIEDHLHR